MKTPPASQPPSDRKLRSASPYIRLTRTPVRAGETVKAADLETPGSVGRASRSVSKSLRFGEKKTAAGQRDKDPSPLKAADLAKTEEERQARAAKAFEETVMSPEDGRKQKSGGKGRKQPEKTPDKTQTEIEKETEKPAETQPEPDP